MKEKLSKAFEQYKTAFGDEFPTIPIAVSRTEEEVIEIINKCVNTNRDVYDLGYVSLEENIMY